jgi:hypothetical protein
MQHIVATHIFSRSCLEIKENKQNGTLHLCTGGVIYAWAKAAPWNCGSTQRWTTKATVLGRRLVAGWCRHRPSVHHRCSRPSATAVRSRRPSCTLPLPAYRHHPPYPSCPLPRLPRSVICAAPPSALGE